MRISQRAYTLIESIVVISIIGILAVTVIPNMRVLYDVRFRNALKKTVSDMRYAQNIAMTRHTNVTLVFNVNQDVYQAEYANGTALMDPFSHGPLLMNFNIDRQYAGIDIVSAAFIGTLGSGNYMHYNWEGKPFDANNGNLTSGAVVLAYRGNSATIRIEPDSGKISW